MPPPSTIAFIYFFALAISAAVARFRSEAYWLAVESKITIPNQSAMVKVSKTMEAAYFAIPILSFVRMDPDLSSTNITFLAPDDPATYHGLVRGS